MAVLVISVTIPSRYPVNVEVEPAPMNPLVIGGSNSTSNNDVEINSGTNTSCGNTMFGQPICQ